MYNFVDFNEVNEIYDMTCFLDWDGGFYFIGIRSGVTDVIPFTTPLPE